MGSFEEFFISKLGLLAYVLNTMSALVRPAKKSKIVNQFFPRPGKETFFPLCLCAFQDSNFPQCCNVWVFLPTINFVSSCPHILPQCGGGHGDVVHASRKFVNGGH